MPLSTVTHNPAYLVNLDDAAPYKVIRCLAHFLFPSPITITEQPPDMDLVLTAESICQELVKEIHKKLLFHKGK